VHYGVWNTSNAAATIYYLFDTPAGFTAGTTGTTLLPSQLTAKGYTGGGYVSTGFIQSFSAGDQIRLQASASTTNSAATNAVNAYITFMRVDLH
jgi:hypothetical protein